MKGLEILALSAVWLVCGAWLWRKERPAGSWRHIEGATTVLALTLWGLLLGLELWHERWIALSLVALPHTLAAAWALARRRDRWALAAVAACLLAGALTTSGIRYVWSPSVPMGLYLTRKVDVAESIAVGQTVCLDPAASAAPTEVIERYLETPPGGFVMKRLWAGPGAELTYDGESLHVDGQPQAHSTILTETRWGDPLPKVDFPLELGFGQVWLGSDHERGFDSRYFGPVGRSAVTCVAEGLWLL